MNKPHRMEIVIELSACVEEMRGVLMALDNVTGEDIPEYEHEPGDAFYNVCEAKLDQIRDMAKLGYDILHVARKFRNQMERDYNFSESVREGERVNTAYSKYDDEMTYSAEVVMKARARIAETKRRTVKK